MKSDSGIQAAAQTLAATVPQNRTGERAAALFAASGREVSPTSHRGWITEKEES